MTGPQLVWLLLAVGAVTLGVWWELAWQRERRRSIRRRRARRGYLIPPYDQDWRPRS